MTDGCAYRMLPAVVAEARGEPVVLTTQFDDDGMPCGVTVEASR